MEAAQVDPGKGEGLEGDPVTVTATATASLWRKGLEVVQHKATKGKPHNLLYSLQLFLGLVTLL